MSVIVQRPLLVTSCVLCACPCCTQEGVGGVVHSAPGHQAGKVHAFIRFQLALAWRVCSRNVYSANGRLALFIFCMWCQFRSFVSFCMWCVVFLYVLALCFGWVWTWYQDFFPSSWGIHVVCNHHHFTHVLFFLSPMMRSKCIEIDLTII